MLVATMTPQAVTCSATFNTHRATANASLRVAVGSWIDALIPLGDHPDVASDAAAENVVYYPGGLHPSAGTLAVFKTVYAAVMDQIIANASGANPAAFAFTDLNNLELSTAYTSTPLLMTGLGLGQSASATVGGGTTAAGLGAFEGAAKPVFNGDAIRARGTTAATNLTASDVTVTVGSRSDTLTLTTKTATAAAFVSGAAQHNDAPGGFSAAGHTISNAAFPAGRPGIAVAKNPANATEVTIDGVAATRVASTDGYYRYRGPSSQTLAAGNQTVVV